MIHRQTIGYEVGDAGWALLRFQERGQEELVFAVSYLHDSLLDLAKAALHLKKGGHTANAVFMDEPGEVHLHAEGDGDVLRFELRHYADWASWGILGVDDFELLAHGDVKREDLVFNIYGVLKDVFENVGVEAYRARWREHAFPLDAYRRLEGLIHRPGKRA